MEAYGLCRSGGSVVSGSFSLHIQLSVNSITAHIHGLAAHTSSSSASPATSPFAEMLFSTSRLTSSSFLPVCTRLCFDSSSLSSVTFSFCLRHEPTCPPSYSVVEYYYAFHSQLFFVRGHVSRLNARLASDRQRHVTLDERRWALKYDLLVFVRQAFWVESNSKRASISWRAISGIHQRPSAPRSTVACWRAVPGYSAEAAGTSSGLAAIAEADASARCHSPQSAQSRTAHP